jgi:hypothetical protein
MAQPYGSANARLWWGETRVRHLWSRVDRRPWVVQISLVLSILYDDSARQERSRHPRTTLAVELATSDRDRRQTELFPWPLRPGGKGLGGVERREVCHAGPPPRVGLCAPAPDGERLPRDMRCVPGTVEEEIQLDGVSTRRQDRRRWPRNGRHRRATEAGRSWDLASRLNLQQQ